MLGLFRTRRSTTVMPASPSLRAYAGPLVVFVGETRPGSPLVAELDRWDITETLDIPQWEGITDRLYVLRRPSE